MSYKIYTRIDEYTKYNVKGLYGLTITEFLNLNEREAMLLLLHAQEVNKKKSEALEDVLGDIDE